MEEGLLGLNKDLFQALSTFSMHFFGGEGEGEGEGRGGGGGIVLQTTAMLVAEAAAWQQDGVYQIRDICYLQMSGTQLFVLLLSEQNAFNTLLESHIKCKLHLQR